MIEIFEGRIGGGKTYTALSRAITHLKNGGTVCTNIRFKWEALRDLIARRYSVEIEPEQLIILPNEQITSFHQHIPWGDLRGTENGARVLVEVDEAHLYFNSRDWASANRETLAFLTQSDKVSVDIIFISQSITNIDKQFRVLMQFVWRFRDLEKWTIPGLGIGYSHVCQLLTMGASTGRHILAVKMDYDGKTMLERAWITKDPELFACYETAALLTAFEVVRPKAETKKLKKPKKQHNKPMYKFALPLLVVGVIGASMLYKSRANAPEPEPRTAPPLVEAKPPMPGIPGFRHTAPSLAEKGTEPKGRYDIYEEQFRAFYGGERTLVTGSGWYQLGEMSGKGLVTAVSDRRVRIEQPDGRVAFVVAVMGPPPVAAPAEAPKDKGKIIVTAADEYMFPKRDKVAAVAKPVDAATPAK